LLSLLIETFQPGPAQPSIGNFQAFFIFFGLLVAYKSQRCWFSPGVSFLKGVGGKSDILFILFGKPPQTGMAKQGKTVAWLKKLFPSSTLKACERPVSRGKLEIA